MRQGGNLGKDAGSVRLFLTLSRVRKNAAFSYGKRTNLYKNLTKNSKIGLVSDEKITLKYVIFWAHSAGIFGETARNDSASYV